MADDSKLVITLDLETGKFEGDIKVVKELLGETGETGHASASHIASGFLLAEAVIKSVEVAVEFFKETLKESISAAMENEQVMTKLNLALANAGIYSTDSSRSMSDFAKTMSDGSVYSKEMILNLEAMAVNFSKSEDGAKKLTRAALELSAATGKDAETSMRILGQSMNGIAVGLDTKLVPGLKNLTEEELRAGKAADVIIERFGGSMAIHTETFTGRVQNLKKSWADLHEEFGKAITDSAIVNRAVEGMTILIKQFTETIEHWVAGGGFEKLLASIIQFSDGVITYVVKPLEFVYNVGKVAFLEITAGLNGVLMVIAKFGEMITKYMIKPFLDLIEVSGKVVGYFNSDFGNAITSAARKTSESIVSIAEIAAESTTEVFKESAKAGGDAIRSMFDTPISDKLGQKVNEMKTFFEGAKAPIKELSEENKKLEKSAIDVKGAFGFMAAGLRMEARKSRDKAGKDFENLGKQMFTAIGSGAANAFSAFGHALATGKNALEAFGQALLKSLGEASVQIGTQMILKGVGYMFDPMMAGFGPGLIAAGAALATFGGFLGGIGGGGAPTAAAGGNVGSYTPVSSTGQPTQSAQDTQKKSAQIVINGDFLNSRETANHLADVLRQNSDITDYTITAQGRSYI